MQYIIGAILVLFLLALITVIVEAFWPYLLAAAIIAVAIIVYVTIRKKKKAAELERLAVEKKAEELKKWEECRAAAKKSYEETLNGLPLAQNIINQQAPKLTRQSLQEMPDYYFTNVTARTNKDKIVSFVVIDTETNGVNVSGGRILELSAIRFEDYTPVAAWTTLVNPGKPIPEEATKVNHITDEMVADAPTLSQVAESFQQFVGSSPIVGYNLAFDLKFLWARGIDIMDEKRKYYDALELSRKAFKGGPHRFRLCDMADYLGIVTSEAHRSLADCYTTGLVFKACVDRILQQ